MTRLRFRDRFFTRPVARAITSPLGIVLFGAATAVGILSGLGFFSPLLGIVAWAARVGVAIPRGGRGERIDPYTLSEPWRHQVLDAQAAVARFGRIVGTALDGPTKDRLTSMASRLDDGLADCWRIATRGDELDAALAQLTTAQAQDELSQLTAAARRAGTTPADQQTIEALQAQLDSAERLRSTRQDAADRLRLLNARFDEIVARAAEVSVGSSDTRGLDDDVTGLVTDLEALRQAIEEVDRATGRVTPSSPLTGPPATAPEPAPPPAPHPQTSPQTSPRAEQ